MPEGDPASGDQGGEGQGGTGTPAPPATTPAKFTQEDVDRINADTRRKAEEAATRKVLEQLGVDDVEKAKQIIEARKAADDAAKSELQKAQEENERLKSENTKVSERAHKVLVLAELKGALRDAGINTSRLDGALKLADLDVVKVAESGALTGIEDVVKSVKDASPEWFGTPGKPFSAPDASGGSGEGAGFNWQTATTEQREAELRKLNIGPSFNRRP